MAKSKSLRCAIYTRKSSEEGLDQAFNSLHAQRDACEAFIKSQVGEGWRPIRTRYDDGGLSGGTMDRPALQQLMADIQSRRVDAVVVYKVDRLTRSLADFAKIVEVFDAHGVSFVSVTQQFNTTTSMGRLTLNVLLSFAQFEREVTSERIRDKIVASKKKGMWMGGYPPLGYNVKDRKLIVNSEEADTVGVIFNRYLELGSVTVLAQELKREDIRSKRWVTQKGNTQGGSALSRGVLYTLLGNRIYRGEIAHKGQAYPGQHDAIVDPDLWDRVQEILEGNRRRYTDAARTSACLLTGLLFDDRGHPMSPTHATKKDGRRYRYYVSQALLKGDKSDVGSLPRVPAQAIEDLVLQYTSDHLTPNADRSAEESPGETHRSLRDTVSRIEIGTNRIAIHTSSDSIEVPICLKTRGGEKLLVTPSGEHGDRMLRIDHTLVKALARAWIWRRALERGSAGSVMELASQAGHTERYVTRLLRLAYLAPDIIDAILEGSQPLSLTLERLRTIDIPLDWREQREVLGFTGRR